MRRTSRGICALSGLPLVRSLHGCFHQKQCELTLRLYAQYSGFDETLAVAVTKCSEKLVQCTHDTQVQSLFSHA